MGHPALYIVLGFTAAAVLGGWVAFRRLQLARPPIGVMGLGDVAVMIGAIVLIPYLYMGLPLWLVAGVFAAGTLSILYFLGEPVIPRRRLIWLAALGLLAADIGTNLHSGAASGPYLLVNDIVLVLVTVGAATLWAQSGMKARDLAVLAGALALYDATATSFLPLTDDLLHRLAQLPLTPMVAWGSGSTQLGIGLGDLLLATVFPLTMRKAFGRAAGLLAAGLSLATIAAMAVGVELAQVRVSIPVMTVLGPLMVLQYWFWIHRRGSERTTWQYHAAEPVEAAGA